MSGICRGIIIGLLSTACVLVLDAATGAKAQTVQPKSDAKSDDRVELIMEGLPPAGTPEYKALFRYAGGDAKGQVLPLTKSEMWAIRRSRLAALKTAAAAKNVTVRELDETTWNEVFNPMSAMPVMDAKSKAMVDMAMQSKSTAGVGMMAPKAAGVVEYALTKGMSDKAVATQPMRIKIGLNEKTTITAVRRSVAMVEGHRCTWHGIVEGTEFPVTIVWWGTGRITGTVQYGDRLYQLKYLGPDMIGVVETMLDKMPDEHARASPKRMQDMKMQEDTLFMQGDSSAMRPKRSDVDSKDDAAKGSRVAVVDPKHLTKSITKSTSGKTGNAAAGKIVIDVMVAYTAKAATHYTDIRRDLIELAIEDTNHSFRASGIRNIEVRLVHTHETDYREDGAEHFDHVWRMADKGDGFMEEIPKLRNEKKADVVVLVVDDAQGCGLATRVAPDAEEAYAVVHHECAATSYSIAHEIGHILGARHDRSLDNNATPFPFGHGFVSPDLKWRTMMSYKAGCNGCPRLLIWSTPAKVVEGKPAGDELSNNARVIQEQAARVAAFR